MTDRELLELAAKAMQSTGHPDFANFEVLEDGSAVCLELGCKRGAVTSYWKPLANDQDAFRAAIHLRIDTKHYNNHVVCFWNDFFGTGILLYGDDPVAATRRAIVMAAAELGMELP